MGMKRPKPKPLTRAKMAALINSKLTAYELSVLVGMLDDDPQLRILDRLKVYDKRRNPGLYEPA